GCAYSMWRMTSSPVRVVSSLEVKQIVPMPAHWLSRLKSIRTSLIRYSSISSIDLNTIPRRTISRSGVISYLALMFSIHLARTMTSARPVSTRGQAPQSPAMAIISANPAMPISTVPSPAAVPRSHPKVEGRNESCTWSIVRLLAGQRRRPEQLDKFVGRMDIGEHHRQDVQRRGVGLVA